MDATVAYLDASAAAKLLLLEPETAALRTLLRGGPLGRISSSILAVELHCLARRPNPATSADVDGLLDTIDLLAPTPAILTRACDPLTPPQRALDAIHIATALSLPLDGLVFVSYDNPQLDAARAEGLVTISPS